LSGGTENRLRGRHEVGNGIVDVLAGGSANIKLLSTCCKRTRNCANSFATRRTGDHALCYRVHIALERPFRSDRTPSYKRTNLSTHSPHTFAQWRDKFHCPRLLHVGADIVQRVVMKN